MTRSTGIARVLRAVGIGGLVALASVSAHAEAPACGKLCARWQLDVQASTDPAAAIATAVAAYKEEKLKRHHSPPSDLAGMAKAELEESLGPMRARPQREELRTELTHLVVIPAQLRLAMDGEDMLIDEGHGGPRRFTPDEPYSRVDDHGTAEITVKWQRGSFVVRENYKKKGSNRETYALDPKGEHLIVTRSIERPSMPDLVLRSVYNPAAAP